MCAVQLVQKDVETLSSRDHSLRQDQYVDERELELESPPEVVEQLEDRKRTRGSSTPRRDVHTPRRKPSPKSKARPSLSSGGLTFVVVAALVAMVVAVVLRDPLVWRRPTLYCPSADTVGEPGIIVSGCHWVAGPLCV